MDDEVKIGSVYPRGGVKVLDAIPNNSGRTDWSARNCFPWWLPERNDRWMWELR